jgi:hypothetical protein
LLWENYKEDNGLIKKFEFSFRSSVEHYYPRNPMTGYKQLKENALDSFGNLCLISHSKNSRLSNQPPIAKRSHYNKQGIDSIKQWVMMHKYEAEDWNETTIGQHEEEMLKVLTQDMDSQFENFDTGNRSSKSAGKGLKWFNQFKNDDTNRSLLARAILCFGDISNEGSNTFYLDELHQKYFLYDWDTIKTFDAYKLFMQFVDKNNPSGLSALIHDQIKNNKSLQKDAFRYIFVKHQEIWDYCKQGYFTWVEDGKAILLHEKEKNTEASSVNLMIILLGNWLETKYSAKIYVEREVIRIDVLYNQEKECFDFVEFQAGNGELIIDCEDIEKIKCHIKPYRNASNSTFVQNLKDYGWQSTSDNYYQKGQSATVTGLTKDYEDDLIRSIDKLDAILKNGLGIKSRL